MVNTKNTGRVLSLFLTILMVCSLIMPMSVFAADVSVSLEGDMNAAGVKKAFGAVNKVLGTFTGTGDSAEALVIKVKGNQKNLIKMDASGTNAIIIDKSVWEDAKQADINKAMKEFVDALGDQGFSDDALQSFMNNMQESDNSIASVMLPLIFEGTQGDMYSAYKITSPFLNVLSVILGVGAVILILLLLFSTVMDLAYIGLPVWREAQAEKNGGKKNPFGVSYEAMRTVQEVEQGLGGNGGNGEYRNAYLLYFKRRALTYIILAICIMYLICGGLSGIIGFVLSLVSGITG